MNVTFIKIKRVKDDNKNSEIIFDMLQFIDEKQFDEIAGDNLNDEFEIMFTFLPEYIVKNLIKVFEKHEIFVSAQDVTSQVLLGQANGNKIFKGMFNTDNIDKHVLPLLENFLRENLTKDVILDKINEQGIESLTKIDKEILQK